MFVKIKHTAIAVTAIFLCLISKTINRSKRKTVAKASAIHINESAATVAYRLDEKNSAVKAITFFKNARMLPRGRKKQTARKNVPKYIKRSISGEKIKVVNIEKTEKELNEIKVKGIVATIAKSEEVNETITG